MGVAAGDVDPTRDARYQQSIDQASYTDRDFATATVTEQRSFEYDGSGFVDIDDCSNITAVTYSISGYDTLIPTFEWRGEPYGGAVFTYLVVPNWGPRFSPEMGFTSNIDVLYREGRFTGLGPTVKVDATWGWTDVPDDVKRPSSGRPPRWRTSPEPYALSPSRTTRTRATRGPDGGCRRSPAAPRTCSRRTCASRWARHGRRGRLEPRHCARLVRLVHRRVRCCRRGNDAQTWPRTARQLSRDPRAEGHQGRPQDPHLADAITHTSTETSAQWEATRATRSRRRRAARAPRDHRLGQLLLGEGGPRLGAWPEPHRPSRQPGAPVPAAGLRDHHGPLDGVRSTVLPEVVDGCS
jgi:hypothetical protein